LSRGDNFDEITGRVGYESGAAEDLLERRADREAKRIRASVDERDVTLTGVVRSWDEKEAILGPIGHAPGVKMIHDHLFIDLYDARFASA
jgi:hypothetical protein